MEKRTVTEVAKDVEIARQMLSTIIENGDRTSSLEVANKIATKRYLYYWR